MMALISINSKREQGPYSRRLFCNSTGQAIVGEYALVILMVLATVVAMTIFFKRGVQARIRDARNYMSREVKNRTADVYDGPVYKGYEPYYIDTDATVRRDITDTATVSGGASSGIYQKDYDQSTEVESFSQTAPPSEFDLTTPQ